MEYKKMERKKRSNGEMLAQNKGSAPKNRGTKFTFLSFVAAGISLAVVKAVNPDMPMRSPAIMLTSVALACAVMISIGRKSR